MNTPPGSRRVRPGGRPGPAGCGGGRERALPRRHFLLPPARLCLLVASHGATAQPLPRAAGGRRGLGLHQLPARRPQPRPRLVQREARPTPGEGRGARGPARGRGPDHTQVQPRRAVPRTCQPPPPPAAAAGRRFPSPGSCSCCRLRPPALPPTAAPPFNI